MADSFKRWVKTCRQDRINKKKRESAKRKLNMDQNSAETTNEMTNETNDVTNETNEMTNATGDRYEIFSDGVHTFTRLE